MTNAINPVSGGEYLEVPRGTERAEESTLDFSTIIADALRDEVTRMSVTAQPGGSGSMGSGYMPLNMQSQGQGIEQLILAAAAGGEVTDAQAALFMLCMMMQTSQDSDFSMIMQMMATMISQISDEEGSLRNSVMSSSYDPYVLDSIDWGVFGNRLYGNAGTSGAYLPLEFWRPTTAIVTSNEDNRSPERYNSVIRQFRVETAERYRPYRDGNTYCNIYVWDVTRAMGAEVPLYTDATTGEMRIYPDTQGATSMTAVKMDAWLKKYGSQYGWHQVDGETAQRYANEGKPAITTAGTIDHVQIVCPSRDGSYDPIRGVTVAQAGSRVTSYTHISDIYSSNALNNHVSYWVHD
ncbi:MAG: hypothetical protein FWG88_07905 [Oscillospiraceae bacterium]|nr:hypothetical protein [Oscillospiraceae bacterium]